jgi:iron(III) transport system substrate-binding protein
MTPLRRRDALAAMVGGLATAAAARAGARLVPRAGEVVLYSSVDSQFLAPIVAAYENASGIKVRTVGDTEATKTTGLVQRLLAERQRPRCDVWWSSEALGTAELARADVLAEYDSVAGVKGLPGGAWPTKFRDPLKRWYALGLRARVVVYNTQRISPGDAPTSLADLLHDRFKGRVGIARPRFGTTRTHVAAISVHLGEPALRELLTRLKAHGVRLFDGNATVVRACATGEILAGLTDTDDVYAGKRNGWPVEMALGPAPAPSSAPSPAAPAATPPGAPTPPAALDALLPALRSLGPLVIPNTVALVRNSPNPEQGRRLIDHILAGSVERALARSESKNTPVRPDVAAEFPELAIPSPWSVDPEAILRAAPRAEALCDEILGA